MERLDAWLSGCTLPPPNDPRYEIESANLDILRAFLALLVVTGDAPDPVSAVRAHCPDLEAFPLQGPPSRMLAALGVARPSGPLVDLGERLRATLTPAQAAAYLRLIE